MSHVILGTTEALLVCDFSWLERELADVNEAGNDLGVAISSEDIFPSCVASNCEGSVPLARGVPFQPSLLLLGGSLVGRGDSEVMFYAVRGSGAARYYRARCNVD